MIGSRLDALSLALATTLLVACARERVDVGDVDPVDAGTDAINADASSPGFNVLDGGLDALPSCGPPPAIGRCQNTCPNGYKPDPDSGAATCECCP